MVASFCLGKCYNEGRLGEDIINVRDTHEPIQMTETEYLEFERQSEFKHEYINGEIFAMAGASDEHNLIVASLIIAIGSQLRGSNCKIYPSDMRVKIEATGSYLYPDMLVLCGEKKFAAGSFDTLLNPSLIIEVLSPSTEAYDRGKKFADYRKISSLQEYVLVSQDKASIERCTRRENRKWTFIEFEGLESSLELSSIGATLDLADVYEQISFP
jgi:Uma2 family endonuclease